MAQPPSCGSHHLAPRTQFLALAFVARELAALLVGNARFPGGVLSFLGGLHQMKRFVPPQWKIARPPTDHPPAKSWWERVRLWLLKVAGRRVRWLSSNRAGQPPR